MESWPQNPEFRNNPENFHPCKYGIAHLYFKGPQVVYLNFCHED